MRKVRDVKYEMRDVKYEMRDVKYEVNNGIVIENIKSSGYDASFALAFSYFFDTIKWRQW